ncbi:MAG: squalene synthase HpnC [Halofilum sp. (in: g-proteobacteria)]|nr:squalene synthase HpnC [Halofilum sp. (in: g-proteobacteria)]
MNAPDAYAACLRQAHAHYENFPVASRLLPRRLRGPVAAIYVFARRADDHADEGTRPAAERLAALDAMEATLGDTLAGHAPADDPLWPALGDAVARFGLPEHELRALLVAFRQDVTQSRYDSFEDVLAYCEHSANPVGRLLLHLAGAASGPNLAAADAVCTGLQLINFLQDLHQDFVARDRLYIPRRDLARHGVTEAVLATGAAPPPVRALLAEQVERAAWWLYQGHGLPRALRGRLRLEIRLIIRGGWRIVEHLRAQKPGEPFARPRLDAADRRWIARGLLPGPTLPRRVTPPAEPVPRG